jgi:putative FmdB family regulatory protein
MPIFEFRCMECGIVFERIFMHSDERADFECPGCQSTSCERVVSITNHAMGLPKGQKQPKVTTKSCGSGNSCMSFTLPGHTRD